MENDHEEERGKLCNFFIVFFQTFIVSFFEVAGNNQHQDGLTPTIGMEPRGV